MKYKLRSIIEHLTCFGTQYFGGMNRINPIKFTFFFFQILVLMLLLTSVNNDGRDYSLLL